MAEEQRAEANYCRAMTDQGGFAAGWYPNPDGGSGLRWYDGERWTDDYHYEVGGAPQAGGYEPQSLAGAPNQSLAQQPPDWYSSAPEPGVPGVYGAPPVPGAQANYIGANSGYQPPPAKSPWGYFTSVITERYADFSGRSRRAEYWWFGLINSLGALVIGLLCLAILPELGLIVLVVWYLGTLVPSLAVTVRRLHDTNKSGWTLLLGVLPLVSIVLLIFLLVDGDRGPNRYGYPPK